MARKDTQSRLRREQTFWSDHPVSGGELIVSYSTNNLNGNDAGGGLARLHGGLDAVVRRGDVGHARTGARKHRAERERSASTQATPMQKWESVHGSDEMK
eukprot:6214628-Pleurochrysis_carterae.AAC.4